MGIYQIIKNKQMKVGHVCTNDECASHTNLAVQMVQNLKDQAKGRGLCEEQ
jgi:hypothetical protein